MKKLNLLFIGIAAIVVVLIAGVFALEKQENNDAKKVVTLYNWGDYIDPTLLTDFEKETGYKVDYETFDANEVMVTKIEQGGTGYDLAFPSDYMIARMKKAGLLEKIDHSKLVGLENIDERFLDLPFDSKNEYSVPYFWGTLGIVYNDKFVKDGDIRTWKDLFKPEYKNQVMLFDGARETMGLGLWSNGLSSNTKSRDELDLALYTLKKKLTPNVKAFVADEMKMYLVQEEAPIGVTFSGEAEAAMEDNEHLHYIIPEGIGNIWFDNIVIPKTAKNPEGAYAFINFMLRPENAARNSDYVGYSTPNAEALKLLDKDVRENATMYPNNEQVKQLETFADLGQKYLELYNDLFLEFKMK
ncbi:MAG: ABC transporter substrate-binding protein [Lactobacillales bacterium]|jgi:spermidine/putrescine transport system substrate-binding protein|nr:ABC transporter substrate-binding protein [Lactobacillales bacterium]